MKQSIQLMAAAALQGNRYKGPAVPKNPATT